MGRFACVVALVMVLVVPNAAARTLKVRWEQDALVAYRVWDEVGFIPIKSIQPDIFKRRTVKVGSTTYKVLWTNTTSNRQTTTMALRQALHDSAYPAVFTDRDLTAVERMRFDTLVDIGRDADVLVVNRDNPVRLSRTSEDHRRPAPARGASEAQLSVAREVRDVDQ